MKYDKYMAMSSCTVFMPDNASGQILPHSSPARKKTDEPVQERCLTVHSFYRIRQGRTNIIDFFQCRVLLFLS